MGEGFTLTKWYLDCVDAQGFAAIIYSARLRFGEIGLSYAASLTNLSGAVRTRTSLKRHTLQENGSGITLRIPRLNVQGSWKADAPRFDRSIFETDDGNLRWSCLQPRSVVDLDIGGHRLNGLGYVDRLDITIPPWRLPITHLRWGRFLSGSEAVTWIDLQGDTPVRLLICNGELTDLGRVDELGLSAPGIELKFTDSRELRSGRLQNTVARQAPLLARHFPRNILQIEESKWLSVGHLGSDAGNCRGWVIHERVKWEQS